MHGWFTRSRRPQLLVVTRHPVEDRVAMRGLIDVVVLDDERSLSSRLPALPDPRQASRGVCGAVAVFGPVADVPGRSRRRRAVDQRASDRRVARHERRYG
jgi:hypothetical protein